MANGRDHLSHFLVVDRVANEDFHRPGRGNPKIRPVEDRAGHGQGRLSDLESAFASSDAAREELLTEEELRALGTIVTLEGEDPSYPLKVDSLQQFTRHRKSPRRPKWLLLSVLPANTETGLPERATVWVADAYRTEFVGLFDKYLSDTPSGKPKNNELVANIARIRATVLQDLWQSDGEPPRKMPVWWEIWLHRTATGPNVLRRFAEVHALRVSARILRLVDRDVMWIEARWDQLEILPFTDVPVAEIRRPEFVDTIEDLTVAEQAEYTDDLAQRLEHADEHQPAVCHLDTGVARTHVLLEKSLAAQDLQTVVGTSGFDSEGHGTAMAGVALFGEDLDQHLVGSHQVVLRHRLESVRIKPARSEPKHDPLTFGDVTAQAISLPESTSSRRRVFCLPITVNGDTPGTPGQPTLWSATVDALAVGSDVVRSGEEFAAPCTARCQSCTASRRFCG